MSNHKLQRDKLITFIKFGILPHFIMTGNTEKVKIINQFLKDILKEK